MCTRDSLCFVIAGCAAVTVAVAMFAGCAGTEPSSQESPPDLGVTITGVVLKDGEPLRGVVVGIVPTNYMYFVAGAEESRVATDQQGRFRFMNVPANRSYYVYGIMESCAAQGGAIESRQVAAGARGSAEDLGVLELRPGHYLSGRVVLSDGQPVPKGTPVRFLRTCACDRQIAHTEGDGCFSFRELPAEGCALCVDLPGYHASYKNGSFDLLNGLGLEGTMSGDIFYLNILLDPGDGDVGYPVQPSNDPDESEERRRRARSPLEGIRPPE